RSTDARYPNDPRTIAQVARLLWREREYAQAAEYLATSKGPLAYSPRSPLASAFAKAFEKADSHETQAAFTALRERRIDPVILVAMARAVGDQGDHRLAFALLGQVPPSRSPSDTGNAIFAHDELEKTEGKEKAMDWLRAHTEAHQLAVAAFQFQRYDVLQEHREDPARPTKGDEVDLLRASALVWSPEPDAAQRDLLRRHFEERPKSVWTPYALAILSDGEPTYLMETIQGNGAETIGWFSGLRAIERGRYEEASDWLQVAVQTDQVQAPPQAWAFELLRRWQGRNKLLSLFTPEDALVVERR
ncbi:MAG TPA: hypothetical protein VMN82_10105, partial [Thermoanaerobaculia bacterium]|nr:hypothetical protein [Thermoanaerobaculia bacterium]